MTFYAASATADAASSFAALHSFASGGEDHRSRNTICYVRMVYINLEASILTAQSVMLVASGSTELATRRGHITLVALRLNTARPSLASCKAMCVSHLVSLPESHFQP